MIFSSILIILNVILLKTVTSDEDIPKFGEPIQNITVSVGRDASFSCVVDNLQTYKVAWLRVMDQTILTIQTHVITKNHRILVSHNENRAWVLKIRDVKETDKGWYMCQINTDPMKNQVGYLNVVVPPDILDFQTSTDMVVREGSNVTMKCAARGSPSPTITWRRESGESFPVAGEKEMNNFNGSVFTITKVNRLNMGPYLCIASNGIPPSVSKRVMLIVHFPPMIWIQNQLVGVALGQKVTLECQSEAYPKSINYWMKNDTIITQGDHFEPKIVENSYKVIMKLTVKNVELSDIGSYKCIAKNSLGDTDGAIKLYQIPQATLQTTFPSSTTTAQATTVEHKYENIIEKSPNHKSDGYYNSNNMGATSTIWNIENRSKDHRFRNDIQSTKINRDQENQTSNSTVISVVELNKLIMSLFIHFILLCSFL